jgi:ATP-dependent DNA helicase RecQ
MDLLGQLRDSLRMGHPPTKSGSGTLPETPRSAYAIYRFLLSWSQAGELGADQAVLLRQALRWSGVTDLFVGDRPASYETLKYSLRKVGVDWSDSGRLKVTPFLPEWLPEAGGCDDPPTKRAIDEDFPAETYLHSVDYSRWRSPAQKEAVWNVLNAGPGATKLIVLPTGSGKSLCFQLLPRFSSGLTVVVVPTVALAMDQQSIALGRLERLPGVNPHFFAADDDPQITVQQLKSQQTRFLFTSPEACVSGRLRPVLDQFAATGWLCNLVLDEAHLIETWGANFRVEFQLLAALRRKWLEASGNTLRTFLFSATMTAECRTLLSQMFSETHNVEEFVCQRLRPEIRYYSRHFNDSNERRGAVIDALWHLPRPTIIYVTEKQEAENFARDLRDEGFRRLGCFHGDTRQSERRDLLRRWKGNELDLMVATSAFGVGVDKPDVRAVVHACFPENLDRYYQEVGRGGRDGWSSVSLLLPTHHDRTVAEGISVRLMKPEMIQKRWAAMFGRADQKGTYTYALPMSSRRTELIGTRTYKENIAWNKRLLLQLHRAGKLELLDLELRDPENPDEDREEWAHVRVAFPPNTPNLCELITPQREQEMEHFRQGVKQLDQLLAGQKCAGRMIAKLYDIPSHQRACPGCNWCFAQDRIPLQCERLEFPLAKPALRTPLSQMIDGCPSPLTPGPRADFVQLIHGCVTQRGLRQFYCPEDFSELVLSCFAEAFPENDPALYRLDALRSDTKISSSGTQPLTFFHLNTISSGSLRIAKGFRSVHFLCNVHNPYDYNGRHVSVNENLRLWSTPDAWFPESQME